MAMPFQNDNSIVYYYRKAKSDLPYGGSLLAFSLLIRPYPEI